MPAPSPPEHEPSAGGSVGRSVAQAWSSPAVEVVRSRARRRTSSARVVEGRIVVRIPSHLPAGAAAQAVEELVARLLERARRPAPATSLPRRVPARPTRAPTGTRGDVELVARADEVAARLLADVGVRAADVRWSHRMSTRWASCTVATARIRLSARVADAPDAVLDCLLLHELAHLVHSGHGPAFRALADRDPLRPQVDAWLRRRSHEELRTALGLAPDG